MRQGLTLIEILLAIALFVVISGVVLVALNPGVQLAKARNSERQMHLNAIMIAVKQNMAESVNGRFVCASGAIPETSTRMASVAPNYNIAPCLVPNFLSALPFDPNASGTHFSDISDYDTGYFIILASSTTSTLITLSAPSAELEQTISVSR